MKAFLYLISAIIRMVSAADHCKDKSSELGFKLTRHAYSSTIVSDYPECLGMCLDDPKCRSLNFGLKSGNCEFNNVSKVGVGPDDFLKDSDNIFSDIVGRESKVPSCKALRTSAEPTKADGEYVIYPAGNPVRVYCDMTTDGGGWTLVKQIETATSLLTPAITGTYTDDYHTLSDYRNNLIFLSPTGLKMLREDMGFDEIRFYCHKINVGKVIHIKTNKDALGEAVVNFYTVNAVDSNFPTACGSFTILPDDTSELSRRCNEWGLSLNPQKWGHSSFPGVNRMYFYPGFVYKKHAFSFNRLLCDDHYIARSPTASGDEYKIFVR